MTNFKIILLNSITQAVEPEWWPYITAFVIVLGAIGTFWGQLKSTYEKMLGTKNEIEIKTLDHKQRESDNNQEIKLKTLAINEARIKKLEERLASLEASKRALKKSHIELMKANVSLSTSVRFLLLSLDRDDPDHKATIKEVEKILKDAKTG